MEALEISGRITETVPGRQAHLAEPGELTSPELPHKQAVTSRSDFSVGEKTSHQRRCPCQTLDVSGAYEFYYDYRYPVAVALV
jgi:hypothetical protein